MRDHGIDMPDPMFDDERAGEDDGTAARAPSADDGRFNAAAEACNQGEGGPMIQAAPAGGERLRRASPRTTTAGG